MAYIPKVKICGMTNMADARDALRQGADTLGFIFYEKSPRYIYPAAAKFLIYELRLTQDVIREFLSVKRNVIVTGVFVNEDPVNVKKIVEDVDIDLVQLSGNESLDYIEKLGIEKSLILKAVHIKDKADLDKIFLYKDAGVNVLADAFGGDGVFGGTGIRVNLDLLADIDMKDLILAGGIDENNVKDIMKSLKPYGFDLSSKIEYFPGKKNFDKLVLFFDNIRRTANEIA